MNLNEYIFTVEPWGREVSAVAATEKEARRMVWDSLPYFYRDNCEGFECIEEGVAQSEQEIGVSATQFRSTAP